VRGLPAATGSAHAAGTEPSRSRCSAGSCPAVGASGPRASSTWGDVTAGNRTETFRVRTPKTYASRTQQGPGPGGSRQLVEVGVLQAGFSRPHPTFSALIPCHGPVAPGGCRRLGQTPSALGSWRGERGRFPGSLRWQRGWEKETLKPTQRAPKGCGQ